MQVSTMGEQTPCSRLLTLANSDGHRCSRAHKPRAPPPPHLCAEPPSSTWVTMMLWGDRFDPLPPVIWIPSPSVPFRMCIFHMRQPSR